MRPPSPDTAPRACAPCSSAAPVARKATSTTLRWISPRCVTTSAAVRAAEVAAAARIIGYDELVMLGYRDSGMPDSEANTDPRCFAKADFDEAVGRFVAVLRRERPQVIITYGDEQAGYPHPDHLPRARHLAAGVRAGWRSRVVSRSRGAVAAVEALLHDLGAGPHGSGARQDARARPRVAIRRQVVRAAMARRPHHHPHRREPVAVGATRRAAGPRHADRSDIAVLVRAVRRGARRALSVGGLGARARSLVGTPAEGEVEHDLFAGIRSEARGGATSSRGTLA